MDAISEEMNRREELHPGIRTKNTARMRPLNTPGGKKSSYWARDEEAHEKRGEPIRSKPREHESSFDTEGVGTGSIFDQRLMTDAQGNLTTEAGPSWRGE